MTHPNFSKSIILFCALQIRKHFKLFNHKLNLQNHILEIPTTTILTKEINERCGGRESRNLIRATNVKLACENLIEFYAVRRPLLFI